MRCRICDLVHKNTKRHKSWISYQVCRTCLFLLEIFSWNNNFLKEHWEA